MLTEMDVKKSASFLWGMRKGEEIGKQKGRLEARQEARLKGIQEGRQEEREANNRKFALIMLNHHVDITVISQSTGFSMQELATLRSELAATNNGSTP